MRISSARAGSLGLLLAALAGLAGCDPDLTRVPVAPDNAPKGESAGAFGPHAHGKIPVSPVSASDLADILKADEPALCTVANGHAVASAKMGDVQSYLESWTKARANKIPAKSSGKAVANQKGNTASASVSVSLPVSVDVTSPGSSNPTTQVNSLAIDCAGARPVFTVNGTARPADVIYAVDGRGLGEGSYLLLAYDAALLDLTAMRLQYETSGMATNDPSFPAWNAVDLRNFGGILTAGTLPARVTRRWDGQSNDRLDWLVVGFALPPGNALGADALIVRAPLDNKSMGGTQYLDVAAAKKKD